MRVLWLCVWLWATPVSATTIYYVATNEPGASNTTCDGLAPTALSVSRCPFKDFSSQTLRSKLINGVDVRVEVRAGTYTLTAFGDAILLHGAGSSFAQATTLTNYPGEVPVFDGSNATREVIRLSGRFVVVLGLTVQNAGAYNIEARGVQGCLIANNRILQNFASDALKGDGGAADCMVQGNLFAGWDSQAIDLAGVSRWTITGNAFTGGRGVAAKCLGMKFYAVDVTVSHNTFTNCYGIAMGGTSSPHAEPVEALRLVVEANSFSNMHFMAVDVYACQGCSFRGNVIAGSDYGLRLAGVASQGASGCRNGAGCDPTTGFTARDNTWQNVHGASPNPNNVFWVADRTELTGLSTGGNRYCQVAPVAERFAIDGVFLDFATWQTRTGTDATSRVLTTCLQPPANVRVLP
jgi:hypothetical protein